MLECLTDIVGVLKDDTPIITQGLTADEIAALRVSTSGLYLDELPGGVHMKALKFADTTKTFSKMATDALGLAVKNLEADLIVALNEKYTKNRKGYQGAIGRMSFATTLATSHRWQGIRIRPVDYIDGIITVDRMNIILNAAATFKLYLYRVPTFINSGHSVMGEVIDEWDINATANAFFTIELTGDNILKLPLKHNGESVEYWFVYDLNEVGAARPKDTKTDCTGCGIKSSLGDFVEASGVGFNDITNLNSYTADNYTRGLIIDVAVNCDNSQLFCREYDDQDAIAVTMGYAVWYRAGEMLIEEVLKQPDVNRYTTQDRTYLWGKRNHFRLEYQNRVKYLAATMDVAASNCYVCREVSNQPTKGKILS